MGKGLLSLLVIFFITFLAIFPLLHKGLPPTHDGEYHIIRFYEFYKTLMSGVAYPRWAADLNSRYGLPLFDFVYPLPNYVASLLHLLGFSFIDSFKYSFVLSTFLGAFSFYYFAKYFTSRLGGVIGAIFYVFTPYRFVDIYVRGSVGEVWTLAIIPLLLWSLAILILERKYYYLAPSSFLFALIIFSHNILALLFLPFLLSYFLLLILKTKKRFQSFLLSSLTLILGLGIAAIFWLPALFEKNYVRGLEVYDYKAFFSDLPALLFPSWGTGFAGDMVNGMSTQIGVINLCVIFFGAFYTFSFFKRRNVMFFFSIIWILIAIMLMLPFSDFFWRTVPLFGFVQFPWRYLSLVILLCSFVASLLVIHSRFSKIIVVVLSVFAIFTTINYTKPAYYHDRNDAYYLARKNFILGTNSPGNAFNTIWIDKPLPKKNSSVAIASGRGKLSQIKIFPERYRFNVQAKSSVLIVINTAYFPGWKASFSEKPIELKRTMLGLMAFSLRPGSYFVTVQFADTIIRETASFITFFSLIISVFISCYYFVNIKKNENRV